MTEKKNTLIQTDVQQHNKINKNCDKKGQCIKFIFISVGVWAVLKLLVVIKSLRQDKKLPLNKFLKKKRVFHKIFHNMQKFSEL